MSTDAPLSIHLRKRTDLEGGSSTKRRKLTLRTSNSVEGDEEVEGDVQQLATRLWEVARHATVSSTDPTNIAPPFLKLPSKKKYPDYYITIKRPISLDIIKQNIDNNAYPSLSSAKSDFDTCFRNAKRYNVKDSQIWLDAKKLQKLVNKEYKSIVGSTNAQSDDEVDVENVDATPEADAVPHSEVEGGEGDAEEGDEDEGEGEEVEEEAQKEKKQKPPKKLTLTRMMKTRMQKLMRKKDSSGYLLATEFIDLPSKKLWPNYYKMIKHPIAFDTILKKIKRKEYPSSNDFAADIELVFSNALAFNEDHSAVWEAAINLKAYFHKLMAELPPEFALSSQSHLLSYPGTAAGPSTTAPTRLKLNLKKPPTALPPAPAPALAPPPKQPSPQRSTQPQSQHQTKPPQQSTRPSYQQQSQSSRPPLAHQQQPSRPQATTSKSYPSQPTATTSRSTISSSQFYPPRQQPSTSFPPAPHAPHPSPPHSIYPPTAISPTPPYPNALAPISRLSPTPPAPTSTRIKYLSLTTQPAGRKVTLRAFDGGEEGAKEVMIRNWSLVLGWKEVSFEMGVAFERDEDEEEDDDAGDGEGGGKVDVRCNGVLLKGTEPASTMEVDTNVNGVTNGSSRKLVNGDHATNSSEAGDKVGGGTTATDSAHSEAEEESDSSPGRRRLTRATAHAIASGTPLPPTSPKKSRKKRRYKRKGAAEKSVVVDGRSWTVPLAVGGNVLDVRVGGKVGEGWRVYVERSM